MSDLLTDIVGTFGIVDHPCLADLLYYQFPVDNRYLLMAREYFPVGSLKAVFERTQSHEMVEFWTPENQVRVLCGIASALAKLHSENLFHGNLTPENILLDDSYRPRIAGFMDFSLEQKRLIVAHEVQSPRYAAPEVYEFDKQGFDLHNQGCVAEIQRMDAYAFGMIAYEILTGKSVFASELSPVEVRCNAGSRDRPSIPHHINRQFAAIIERCWDSQKPKRPTLSQIWNVLDSLDFAPIAGLDPKAMRTRVIAMCQ
jgi:serine/threonine protein kinase